MTVRRTFLYLRPTIPHLHAVPREVDAQRRLRELRRHLLGRQVHHPRRVGMAVQAQVLFLRVALFEKFVDLCADGWTGTGWGG